MSIRKAKRELKRTQKESIRNRRQNMKGDIYSPTNDMVAGDRRLDGNKSGLTEGGFKAVSDYANGQEEQKPIGREQIIQATSILQKYKDGKVNLEKRIIGNEQWWKGRHWEQISEGKNTDKDIQPASAWLFNCIMSKYADYMDAFPEPNILPREEGDKEEAKMLSSIIPVVLEQNGFYKVYSSKAWKILKDGSGIYGCFWDGNKLNGLGDITIKNIDFLNLFWEPGITDIQESENVFHCNLVANSKLEQMYPELKGELGGSSLVKAEYIYDDNVDVTDKSMLIEWYYKKWQNGKQVVHYVKYVGEHLIYASENDTERPTSEVKKEMTDSETGEIMLNPETGEPVYETVLEETGEESIAERGWYDHGLYPYIVETMFPVEGSLCGFSYIDICKEPQKYIDLLDQAVLKNSLMNAIPRWFVGSNADVNEDEFLDWRKPLVHVTGALDELKLREIPGPEMNGSAITKVNDKINEMKETTGNTDVSRGNVGGGITSGSAISALQESAGKTSRSQNQMAYDAYSDLITMVIELIRQFYDVPRQFRILGKEGYEYIQYSNANIKPQQQANDFDIDGGFRLPVFDVEVNAQKANPYSKNSQNELAMELYGAGFFAPQNADVALACLEVMDFKHKQDVVAKIQGNAMLYNENIMLKQELLNLSSQMDKITGSNLAANLQQAFMEEQQPGKGESASVPDVSLGQEGEEHPFNERARNQANAATQVN